MKHSIVNNMDAVEKHVDCIKALILSYSLKVVIVISMILALWRRDWFWVFGTLAGLIVSFIPTLLKRDIKFTLPWPIEMMIAAITFLHMGGRLLEAYSVIPGYLKLTHFVISIFVAFLAFAFIYILDEHWDGLQMDKYAMAFVVVFFTMAAGVLMEFGKWITDYLFGQPIYRIWTLENTLGNLFITSIAGVIIAIIGVSLIKRGEFEEITEELGKQIDSTVIHRKKQK